jgi:outer membrane protein assembly factor BamB
MSDVATAPQIHPAAPRGHRLWFLAVVALLAVGAIAFIQLRPEGERNFKAWLTVVVLVLTLPLGAIWLLFLSRFAWSVRLIAFALLLVLGVGLKKAVRVDGTASGTGLPKLAWRWTPVHAPGWNAPAVSKTAAPSAPAAVAQLEGAADVPQFFGPNRDGVYRGAHLARDWSASPPKELWRHPVGAGWASFAVVGGRAYTQEQRGEEEAVTCYELATGRLLWLHTNRAHFFEWQGGDGPRATPTFHEGRLYVMGATGLLDCLDATTGRVIWTRSVLTENNLPNLKWGVSDSPLVFEGTVVVTGGETDGPTALAFRSADGQPLWKSGHDHAAYSSPVLATLAGRRMVLTFNQHTFSGYDASTGELLIDYPFSKDQWPKAAQPVVIDDHRVFISAGYGAGCALLEIAAGPDGKLTANPAWKNLRMKTQFNSAALRDGFLYGLDDGSLACVDVATGDRKWKGGHYGSGQSILADDLVLIQSETGPVALAEAKPDAFKELGRIPAALNAKTWNYPTLAGRYLLIRNSEEMACYELPVEK